MPGGVFVETVKPASSTNERSTSRCLVTTSLLDGLAVLGAVAESEEELFDENVMVFAPARPRGYSVKDLKEISARTEMLTVLGRDGEELVDRLRDYGATVSLVAKDVNIARTLLASGRSGDALAELVRSNARGEKERVVTVLPALKVDDVALANDVAPVSTSGVTLEPVISATPGRDETYVQIGSRSWRVRGAQARGNIDGDRLSVALSVVDESQGRFHLDTLDLYSARQRSSFLDTASSELRVERTTLVADVVHVLRVAEVARDEWRNESTADLIEMTDARRDAALAWLQAPDLLARLCDDLAHLEVVGEESNLLVCYLAALSRKCARPLGVLIQSPSAGGKSTLMEAVTAMVPPEDLVSLAAITSQALYYLGGTGLRHKVLFVAEERGSARASYALKLLVSEGRLAIASTGKDPSGQLRTRTYETVGPLSLMMTTTATTLDPELENRLVVLGVDENAAQTQAIIKAQLEAASLAGLHARTKANEVRARHHDIQRLLEPIMVVIPDVTLSFPSSTTRHRRDHAKLLSMIAVVTLLHQHQRERRTELVEGVTHTYLEATPHDIEVASRLCANVLARDAEALAPQARRLLDVVRSYASHCAQEEDCETSEIDVTRRQLRERLGWSDTQVRAATDRLVALEYLVVSGGGRGRCRTYRLVHDFAPMNFGAVGDYDQRTSHATPSGEERQFVQFVPFADSHERGTSYTDVSYPDTAGSTSKGASQ